MNTAVTLYQPEDIDFGAALAGGQVAMPAVIERAGARVAERLIEFFTAHIENRNTRRAYGRAAWQFFDWMAANGLELCDLKPVHVARWLEGVKAEYQTASVKQHLAAVRMLLGYLTTGGLLHHNPAGRAC